MSKRKPELKLVEDTGSELLTEELPELPPQQSEMPFAVVEGEPMTELPRDLYIPPDALQVFLEAFEGPLDLLLYLIRKQNLDILDIPIAEITRQYMKYIEVMADLQLELAGEYLLMAAMLAEIKSRMLLPRPPSAEGQEEDDPRAELVRRLQEYERFKKAAEDIDQLARLERDTVPASAELQERKIVKLLPEVTLNEMLSAFKDVLARAEKFAHHHITRERLSQRERMSEILSRLQTTAFFEFSQLFKPEEGRMGVTVTFIAILELMKEGLIEIVQAEAYAPIHVRTAQRHLKVVPGGGSSALADAENVAALAQPELEGENDIEEEDVAPPGDAAAQAEEAAVEGALAEAEAVAVALGVDEIVIGDAPASTVAAAEDSSVTTPPVEELTAEAAEAVVVADAEQPVSEATVAEVVEQEPIVVASDSTDVTQQMFAGYAPDVVSEAVESEASAAVVGDDTPAMAPDNEAFAALESNDAPAVAAEFEQEGQAAPEFDEPAFTPDEETLGAAESYEQSVASDEPVAAVSELDVEPSSALDEQLGSPSDAEALGTAESYDVASDVEQETIAVSDADEPVVIAAEIADATFAAVEETSGDAQASVVLESEADEGAALETVVEEHVVEEHAVPEHVVEESVVPEHVVEDSIAQIDQAAPPVEVDAAIDAAREPSDITDQPVASADTEAAQAVESNEPSNEQHDELSVSDDSVTESSSEADNSDAEPSR